MTAVSATSTRTTLTWFVLQFNANFVSIRTGKSYIVFFLSPFQRAKHNLGEYFECKICSKKFRHRGGLNGHLNRKHNEDKGFSYIESYEAHMASVAVNACPPVVLTFVFRFFFFSSDRSTTTENRLNVPYATLNFAIKADCGVTTIASTTIKPTAPVTFVA